MAAGKKRRAIGGPLSRKSRKTENVARESRMTLEEQIESETVVSGKSSRRSKARMHQEEDNFVDASMTTKILKEARKQQQEVERERDEADEFATARKAFASLSSRIDSESDDEDEDEPLDSRSEFDFAEEVPEEEERLLSLFLAKDAPPQRTLTDMIMSKIRDNDVLKETAGRAVPGVDQRVMEIYHGVGELLSRYTAGKLPKAFKLLPKLSNWEELLYLTEPENWSPHAMFQATRIFASNLNSRLAERFYRLVLLPRVRHDISAYKKPHFAVYQALKKAVYKPAAFYKGILLAICKSRTCSLREAVILGSVIQKVSIPAVHSGIAISKIAEMEYAGTNSYFLKLLLNKKYALPYRVIDSVVSHFLSFENEERVLPVIWHQSLLTFVQRYKNTLTEADKQNLRRLMEHQEHYLVTPEIKRELQHSLNRGQKAEDEKSMMVVQGVSQEDVFNLPEVEIEMDDA